MSQDGIVALAVFGRDLADQHSVETEDEVRALLGTDVRVLVEGLDDANLERLGALAIEYFSELESELGDVDSGLRALASDALVAAEADHQAAGVALGLEWPVIFGLIFLVRLRKLRLGKFIEVEMRDSPVGDKIAQAALAGDASGSAASALIDAANERGPA